MIKKGWGILVKKNKGRMEVVVCLRRRRGYLWHTKIREEWRVVYDYEGGKNGGC